MFGITNKIKLISSLIFFKINQQEEQARENEAQFCRNNKEKLETWINQNHDKQLEIDPEIWETYSRAKVFQKMIQPKKKREAQKYESLSAIVPT